MSKQKTHIQKNKGEKVFDIFNVTSMLIMCFVVIYPFWYILVYSFNESKDASAGGLWFWPRKFTLINYRYIFDNPYITSAFMVSISRAVLFTVFSVLVSMLTAYALSKRSLPGRKFFIFFFMVPIFISGTLVSNYIVIAKLGFLNNFFVYVVPFAFSFFNMIIMRTFIEQLPSSLEESTMIDGAGYFRIFISIIMPLTTPILATMAFFSIVGSWLDLGTNLFYVTDKKLTTVQLVLYNVVINSDTSSIVSALKNGGSISDIGGNKELPSAQVLKMSTLVMVTFPMFFVYPFFQRYFIKGLLVGSIKA